MRSTRKLIIITGPTAVGKTNISIDLAKVLNTEIISCDSRQLYKEMTIGTAKPSDKELASVPHHFINHRSISDGDYSVGDYERECDDLLANLFQDKEHLIMTGGTGLYISAIINGLDNYPDIPTEIREKYNNIYSENGLIVLQKMLKKADPEYFLVVDKENPRRLIRALELIEVSGEKYSDLRKNTHKNLNFEYSYFVLNRDRSELYNRINQRVDLMMEKGLLDEAKELYAYKDLKALQTVGYKELFKYFDGGWDKDYAIDKIKQHSRNYAKRQLTWFRKVNESKWLNANKVSVESLLKKI